MKLKGITHDMYYNWHSFLFGNSVHLLMLAPWTRLWSLYSNWSTKAVVFWSSTDFSVQFHSVRKEVKSNHKKIPSKHLKHIVMLDVNSNSSLVSDGSKHNFNSFRFHNHILEKAQRLVLYPKINSFWHFCTGINQNETKVCYLLVLQKMTRMLL